MILWAPTADDDGMVALTEKAPTSLGCAVPRTVPPAWSGNRVTVVP
jgi:hypothetical protein